MSVTPWAFAAPVLPVLPAVVVVWATAEVASATVVGPSLADADAFATTLFVMGIGGLYWVDDQPGYGAMVITHDGAVLSTARFDRHRVPLAA